MRSLSLMIRHALRRHRLKVIVLFIVVTFVVVLYLRRVPPFSHQTIDKYCSKTSKHCYKVADVLVDDPYARVERWIHPMGSEGVDTIAIIRPEEGTLASFALAVGFAEVAFSHSNTQLWKVDHSVLPTQYVAVMAAVPLAFQPAFEAVAKSEKAEPVTALEIGLGGGGLGMFVHDKLPMFSVTCVELDELVVETARKWFGHVEDERRKILVGDGVKFVLKAAERGEKFHNIWLDAQDTNITFASPAPVFRTEEVVKAFRTIIHDNGVFSTNLVIVDEDQEEAILRDEVEPFLELLREHFAFCARWRMSRESNGLIVCTASVEDETKMLTKEELRKFYERRIAKAGRRLGLVEDLKNITLFV